MIEYSNSENITLLERKKNKIKDVIACWKNVQEGRKQNEYFFRLNKKYKIFTYFLCWVFLINRTKLRYYMFRPLEDKGIVFLKIVL